MSRRPRTELAGPGAPPAVPGAIRDVQLLMTPPGLRWFQSHTHSRRIASLVRPLAQVVIDGLDVSITGPNDLIGGSTGMSNWPEEINASGQIAGTRSPTYGFQNPEAIRWSASGSATVLHKASPDGQA
jgi:hypothetical protein